MCIGIVVVKHKSTMPHISPMPPLSSNVARSRTIGISLFVGIKQGDIRHIHGVATILLSLA